MKKLVEKIISILKNDKNYKLDENYSFIEILTYSCIRGKQVLRGFSKKLFIQKSEGLLFCGVRVKVLYPHLVQIGRNCIFENNVFLDALSYKGIILGNNVTIAKNSIIQCTGVIANKGVGIKIGNNSAVGAQSYLGGQGGIEIGDDVIMGPGVKIFSENHVYDKENIPIRKQGETRKGVKIDNNCWIGANTTILDGVTIGEGCVVAAGSVVTKSVPPNKIVAGIPSKIIKGRFE